jgi:general secretion pathway protein D
MYKLFITVLSLLIFVSCAQKNEVKPVNPTAQPYKQKVAKQIKADDISVKDETKYKKEPIAENPDNSANQAKKKEYKEPKVYKKSPVVLKSNAYVKIKQKGEKYEVNLVFDSADVFEVIKTIFNDLVKEDFILDPAVKGSLTLSINGTYTKNEILDIVSRSMDLAGLSLIKNDKYYYITTKNNSKEFINVNKSSGIYAIEILQLNNIDANYFAKNITPFISRGATVVSIPTINAFIIYDKKENIKNVKNILGIIDNNVFKNIKFKIFAVKNIKASEAALIINEILKSSEIISKPGVVKSTFVTPLKSNNSILIMTRNDAIFKYIMAWLTEIDQASESETSGVYVYYVENGEAKKIADLLKQLYGQAVSTREKGEIVIKGKTSETKTATLKKSAASGELQGNVNIIPDEDNNALIIKANPDDYKTIMKVIKKIDIIPKQVMIKVMIAEVTYTKKSEVGIQWFLKNKGIHIGDVEYTGDAMLNQGMGMAEDTPLGSSKIMGFAYGLYNPASDLVGLLHLLAEDTEFNLLSSPNILAIDNQEATIEVGQDVPTVTQTVNNTNSNGNVTNTIQYRKTGILLTVKPQINSQGLVKLTINQEVSQAIKNKVSGIDSPTFLQRKANTSLVVQDGQTVVIGGLIQDKVDDSDSGIPFLKDIPFLGYLFGGKKKENEKVELMIAITPKVVEDSNAAQVMTNEFLRRVENIKKKLSKFDDRLKTPEEISNLEEEKTVPQLLNAQSVTEKTQTLEKVNINEQK